MSDRAGLEGDGMVRPSFQGDSLAAMFDARLAGVWLEVFTSGAGPSGSTELLGCFLRMAYLRGYEDGLCEAQPGSLFTSLGLPIPPRRTPGGRA